MPACAAGHPASGNEGSHASRGAPAGPGGDRGAPPGGGREAGKTLGATLWPSRREGSSRTTDRAKRLLSRLVDDPDPAPQSRRKFSAGQGLQRHEPMGQRDGAARLGRGPDVAVHVGAGQGHYDRCAGTVVGETGDGGSALTRVQGDQDVEGLPRVPLQDLDAMAQPAQDARPAQGGRAIPAGRSRARRRDQSYPEVGPPQSAQVRNPAHTSRRSGG